MGGTSRAPAVAGLQPGIPERCLNNFLKCFRAAWNVFLLGGAEGVRLQSPRFWSVLSRVSFFFSLTFAMAKIKSADLHKWKSKWMRTIHSERFLGGGVFLVGFRWSQIPPPYPPLSVLTHSHTQWPIDAAFSFTGPFVRPSLHRPLAKPDRSPLSAEVFMGGRSATQTLSWTKTTVQTWR